MKKERREIKIVCQYPNLLMVLIMDCTKLSLKRYGTLGDFKVVDNIFSACSKCN